MHLQRWDWLDVVGTVLSALCIVHCLALPVLVAVLPLVGTNVFETGLGVGLISVASLAILTGVVRHRHWQPLVPFAAGVGCYVAAAISARATLSESTVLSVVGSVFFALAHFLNYRASHAGHSHGLFSNTAPAAE